MKSKLFDLTKSPADKQNLNKTLDFIGLYKPAGETNVKLAEKRKSAEVSNKENPKNKVGTSKRERSPNKNRKKNKQEQLDLSQINIDGSALNTCSGRSSPTNDAKVTSTPNTSAKTKTQASRVKSIIKNSIADHSMEISRPEVSTPNKPKKRNKSVSFMLDDNEEVVIKKTKSDDSQKVEKSAKVNIKKKNIKKGKKNQSEKENKANSVNKQNAEIEGKQNAPQDLKPKKMQQPKTPTESPSVSDIVLDADNAPQQQEKKKKFKKAKKLKPDKSTETVVPENNNNEVISENKTKKLKKKKHHMKQPDTSEGEGEPASKTRKQDKADIAEDLENLSIGDNAHTLTNLLDEMTVVDKEKRKKMRQKFKKNKKQKTGNSSPEPGEVDKNEEGKEKIKWKRRKWNRDKKGEVNEEGIGTSVIVENLPLSIMLNYKKLLTDHFGKYGLIKKIGIAEVYPTEESKPVFTTTINFYSDGAVEQALEDDNTYFEGSRIHVKTPLPPTQTTLVVRTYADLTDQAISSAFLSAGRIRSIRHLVKGKKAMGTAFVEFDGPDSVEKAIKMSANAKIGGKKIHVAKFELRVKRDKKPKSDGDSAVEADSEDSND